MTDTSPSSAPGSDYTQYELPDPPQYPTNQNTADQQALGTIGNKYIVQDGGSFQSQNYVPGTSGYYLGPDTAQFNFTVSVASLNIPDSTTANSFHVDSSGNTWWGSNVSSGYPGANAYILNNGAAFFNNIKIGGTTYQYTITDNGVFSFGDGSDGTAAFDGSATPTGSSKSGSDYTLTRDVYYTNLTMSTGTTLNPAGYRIFVTGTLTLNGTAVIKRNGNAGANGAFDGSAAAGGAALADGYLKGSVAGGAGGTGPSGVGVNGTNTTNSIGSNGSGGGGGTSTGGTATPSNVKLIANWHLATMLDISASGSTVKFDNSAGAGGGGNGFLSGGHYGGGGGGGSAGGIIAIYARNIVIGASASITAIGGKGGDANVGGGTNSGSGGGGGNGGQIILVYNVLTNSGSILVTGGVGGTAGTGGTAGVNGSDGTVRQFQISL